MNDNFGPQIFTIYQDLADKSTIFVFNLLSMAAMSKLDDTTCYRTFRIRPSCYDRLSL